MRLKIWISAAALTMNATLQAGVPLWSIQPLTPTNITVSSNSLATVQYRVTNQSHSTHTLKMIPITGITQITAPGNCPNSFTLSSSNPSCILTLQITGSTLNADIYGGPKICQQSPDGNPNPLQCYQPSQNNLLNIKFRQEETFARYAYFANFNNNTVSQCAVNTSTGELFSCAPTGSGFSTPYGLAVGNGYAYIANFLTATISQCTVNLSTGAFFNCVIVNGFNSPTSVALNNGYAYILNTGNNTVSQCTVNPSTGALSNCANTGSGFLAAEGGIAFYNGYVYVAGGGVQKCTVSPVTGAFSNCNSTGSGYNGPLGIAVYNGFAYITDYTSDTVVQCTVNPVTGELAPCSTTGSGFNGPNGAGAVNGYAYINNYDGGTVTKCTINPSTGTLLACASSGSGFDGPAGNVGFLIQ